MRRAPAGHPHHDAGVALPHAHEWRARDPARRRGGHRRRDPRRRRDQARVAPGADARAARRAAARRARSAAHRPVRHAEPARGDRTLPRRPPAQRARSSTSACERSSTCASTYRSSRWSSPIRRPPARRPRTSRPWSTGPPHAARSGRRSTRRSCGSSRRTPRRSCSSTTAAGPSGSRCGSTSCATRARATPRTRPDAPYVEIARAHHGSLAREERTVIEEQLKRGELPCLVATSSLELGIDMGAVDLVIQVESPKSVSRGLQRIGRAGHGVGERSAGRIFPKFRADLLECAVVARLMREGRIEPTVVPRNALDVLAQQIVAIAAAAGEDEPVSIDDLPRARHRAPTPTPSSRASCSRTSSTCSTGATRRRSSPSCARASSGTASPTRSARARAPAAWRSRTRARSPTAACTPSCCPTGAASASSTRRWSTRRGRGRRSCSAPRAGASRRSAATA